MTDFSTEKKKSRTEKHTSWQMTTFKARSVLCSQLLHWHWQSVQLDEVKSRSFKSMQITNARWQRTTTWLPSRMSGVVGVQ
jgi:hypothetical protein